MIIEVKRPQPTFSMTFDQDEGWTVVAALKLWAEQHPVAHRIGNCKAWADELDKELRKH